VKRVRPATIRATKEVPIILYYTPLSEVSGPKFLKVYRILFTIKIVDTISTFKMHLLLRYIVVNIMWVSEHEFYAIRPLLGRKISNIIVGDGKQTSYKCTRYKIITLR